MSFMPFHLPKLWLRGLLSAGVLAAGVYCLSKAFERRPVVGGVPKDVLLDPDPSELELCPADTDSADRLQESSEAGQVERDPGDFPEAAVPPVAVENGPRSVASRSFGVGRDLGLLLAGLGLVGWSLGGGRAHALSRRRGGGLKPRDGVDRRLRRPDGTEIHVEFYGPPDGAPILFVHGLGSDCDEWFEIRERLVASGHRVIDWDLPGLGQSTPPCDGDWSLERVAGDLEAVVAAAGDRPPVLLGHSLGGMILLTFCRLFPEALGTRVAGLVLAHTTYTNPMKTNSMPGLAVALQGPLVEPLCHLTIGLSPMLWPVSVLDYLSGEAHRTLAHSLFCGGESREVLDFLAGYFVRDRPEAVGRYSLAMLRYDATATLETIYVPTLIVAGDRDDSCTPQTHAFMHERISGSRLLTLSPAKHGGLLEHPQQFTEALATFVAGCASRPAGA